MTHRTLQVMLVTALVVLALRITAASDTTCRALQSDSEIHGLAKLGRIQATRSRMLDTAIPRI